MEKAASDKEAQINDLKAKLDAGETNKQLAVSEAWKKSVEKERDNLVNELKHAKQEK